RAIRSVLAGAPAAGRITLAVNDRGRAPTQVDRLLAAIAWAAAVPREQPAIHDARARVAFDEPGQMRVLHQSAAGCVVHVVGVGRTPVAPFASGADDEVLAAIRVGIEDRDGGQPAFDEVHRR